MRCLIAAAVAAATLLLAGSAFARLPAAHPPTARTLQRAHVELRVSWPVGRRTHVAPGARLAVRVGARGGRAGRAARRTHARIALVRVNRRGRALRTVRSALLRPGGRKRAALRVPRRAHRARYALRLRTSGHRFWSWVIARAARDGSRRGSARGHGGKPSGGGPEPPGGVKPGPPPGPLPPPTPIPGPTPIPLPPTPEPTPGPAPKPCPPVSRGDVNSSGVFLCLDHDSGPPGDIVGYKIFNNSNGSVSVRPCPVTWLQRTKDGWQPAPGMPHMMCPDYIRLLGPGQTMPGSAQVWKTLKPGDYLLSVPVGVGRLGLTAPFLVTAP